MTRRQDAVPDAGSAAAGAPGLAARARAAGFGRVIGQARGALPGPTLICVSTLHGNEPAGALALQRVFHDLKADAVPVRGEILGLVANLRALQRNRRFISFDLNRDWLPDRVAALLAAAGTRTLDDEEAEQVELAGELHAAFDRARGPVYLIDLHTTSGASPPFATLGDTLRNRAFARAFPLPTVLGLEEQLEGALLEWVGNLGYVTMGFEGGQHEDPAAVANLESVIWIAARRAGIASVRPTRLAEARARLQDAGRMARGFTEVRYRHDVPAGVRFVMNPGWVSFQPVQRGQVLAVQDGADVTAPESGRLLMPLYQAQGEDGFFIIRDVRVFWLRVSSVLRWLRADRIAPWLPGVRRHHENPEAVVVDRRKARWYAVEIFHLLGYRRELERGHELVMSRRHFDQPLRRARRKRR